MKHAPKETRFHGGFVPNHGEVMAALLAEVAPTLTQGTIRIFGREVAKPRLESWHGDRAYTYSGRRIDPAPFTPTLERIRAMVSEVEGVRFDSVLVTLYRDGSDSIAFHADDEPELGPSRDDVRIASVSLGASRRFVLKRRDGSEKAIWILGGGSLFVMSGRLQETHVHGVPKTAHKVGPRMNLTFRVMRGE